MDSMQSLSSEVQSYLGVDVGGSNIFAVLFDQADRPLHEKKIDTEAKGGYEHVLFRIRELIHEMEVIAHNEKYILSGIGLGVPGVISASGDEIEKAPNLGWNHVSLLKDLGLDNRKDLGAVLINDVNAGLLGELARFVRPPSVAIAYFCGTGIGGAIALDGKLLTGFSGGAGEVGHMVVEIEGRRCGCGKRGCLEAYIGKSALGELVETAIAQKRTALKDIIQYDLRKKPIKSASLKAAYQAGDEFTVDLMEEYYCRYLAIGISQSVHLLNPEMVILGGGVMEAMGRKLLPHVFRHLTSRIILTPPQLILAESGDYAGPLGSARITRMG